MDENTSLVYILTDSIGRILRCDGGATQSLIDDPSAWIMIDSGVGDKYYLCQTHYFDGGLYTEDGICRYRWNGTESVLRTDADIASEREEIAQVEYPAQRVAELKRLLADSDYAVIKIAEGAADREEYATLIEQRQAWREEINVQCKADKRKDGKHYGIA